MLRCSAAVPAAATQRTGQYWEAGVPAVYAAQIVRHLGTLLTRSDAGLDWFTTQLKGSHHNRCRVLGNCLPHKVGKKRRGGKGTYAPPGVFPESG